MTLVTTQGCGELATACTKLDSRVSRTGDNIVGFVMHMPGAYQLRWRQQVTQ